MRAIEVTPRAAAQIERAALWWAEHRLAAPDAVRIEFQEACTLLSRHPGVGAKSSSAGYPDLRRLHLSRIRYHVYYRASPDKVMVLAFWHSNRGGGPGL